MYPRKSVWSNCKNPFKVSGQPLKVSDLSLKDTNEHSTTDGTIPDLIGSMSSLQSIDLSYNHLSGELPEKLWDLSALAEVTIEFNKMTGVLPEFNDYSNNLVLLLIGNNTGTKRPP